MSVDIEEDITLLANKDVFDLLINSKNIRGIKMVVDDGGPGFFLLL
jgi:hypothetical protein